MRASIHADVCDFPCLSFLVMILLNLTNTSAWLLLLLVVVVVMVVVAMC